MSGERKSIRDWAFALLVDQFNLPVEKQRAIDSTEHTEFFNVYCTNNVEFVQDGLKFYSRATLTIGYHLQDFDSDDQLEIMSDQVIQLVLGSAFPEDISGVIPESIEDNGDAENRAFNSVFIRFTVIY